MKAKTKKEAVEEIITSETVENEVIQPATDAEADEMVESTPQTNDQTEPTVPLKVLGVLKKFKSLDKAYVNSKGGVFSVDTPEHIRGNAVLYKNPYFNN